MSFSGGMAVSVTAAAIISYRLRMYELLAEMVSHQGKPNGTLLRKAPWDVAESFHLAIGLGYDRRILCHAMPDWMLLGPCIT